MLKGTGLGGGLYVPSSAPDYRICKLASAMSMGWGSFVPKGRSSGFAGYCTSVRLLGYR